MERKMNLQHSEKCYLESCIAQNRRLAWTSKGYESVDFYTGVKELCVCSLDVKKPTENISYIHPGCPSSITPAFAAVETELLQGLLHVRHM